MDDILLPKTAPPVPVKKGTVLHSSQILSTLVPKWDQVAAEMGNPTTMYKAVPQNVLTSSKVIAQNNPILAKEIFDTPRKPIYIPLILNKDYHELATYNKYDKRIGLDYIPPLNSILETVGTLPISRTIVKQLPQSFDWANQTSMTDPNVQGGITQLIRGPPNQLLCGSAWAANAVAVLGDRWSIYSNGAIYNPRLSVTYVLSCLEKDKYGCNGGLASAACKFLEQNGAPTDKCQSYGWCGQDNYCSGQVRFLSGYQDASDNDIGNFNYLVPDCHNDCTKGPNPQTTSGSFWLYSKGGDFKLYKARSGSTKMLTSPKTIKSEIFLNGPVLSTFLVWSDFVIGPAIGGNKDMGWSYTNNIYIHGSQDSVFKTRSGKKASELYLGAHTVSIVGWGVDIVPRIGTVPYWVIRNTWSSQWQNGGYAKFAMYPYNQQCGLDVPCKVMNQQGNIVQIGGAITIAPDLPNNSYVHHQSTIMGLVEKQDTVLQSEGPIEKDNKKSYNWVYIASVVFILILVILILVIR